MRYNYLPESVTSLRQIALKPWIQVFYFVWLPFLFGSKLQKINSLLPIIISVSGLPLVNRFDIDQDNAYKIDCLAYNKATILG